jgi:hypothetical protein
MVETYPVPISAGRHLPVILEHSDLGEHETGILKTALRYLVHNTNPSASTSQAAINLSPLQKMTCSACAACAR